MSSLLIANALVGDRGLVDSLEARRRHARLSREVESLRRHNDQLRREARRLREDPGAIEEAARRDLGLIRPGERVFLFSDRRPPRR